VRDGAPALHIDGWSFPQQRVHTSPLEAYSLPTIDDAPVFGILHGDFDQAGSVYAPLLDHEFTSTAPDFWLLGHIHAPRLLKTRSGKTILYPGSPMAMDPGETGWHGAWMVEFAPGRAVTPRQLRLSCVRYDTIEIPLDGVHDPDEFNDRVTAAVQGWVSDLSQDEEGCGDLQIVNCRLILTGRTRLHRALGPLLDMLKRDLQLYAGSIAARVETVRNNTRPEVDLEVLASRNDPPGEVARMLLAFEREHNPPEYDDLLERTKLKMVDIHRTSTYSPVASDPPPDTTAAREALLAEGWRFLDVLVAQREHA
jgi:DNA repair exonuclease SbcCD nuclease subunit